MLTQTAFQPLYGKLSDLIGRMVGVSVLRARHGSDGSVFRWSCTLVSLFLPQALRYVVPRRYAAALLGRWSSDEWPDCTEHYMVNSCTSRCWRRRRGYCLSGLDYYVRDRRRAQSGKMVPSA